MPDSKKPLTHEEEVSPEDEALLREWLPEFVDGTPADGLSSEDYREIPSVAADLEQTREALQAAREMCRQNGMPETAENLSAFLEVVNRRGVGPGR